MPQDVKDYLRRYYIEQNRKFESLTKTHNHLQLHGYYISREELFKVLQELGRQDDK